MTRFTHSQSCLWIGLLLSSSLAAQVQQNQPLQEKPVPVWQELGPAPISGANYAGRISTLVCSPTDPNLYYAGGADAGVWRTTDGGASWEALTDHLATTSVGALALDPSDEQVIYLGTGEPNYANHSRYGLGLFKSLDGGDSWQHIAKSVFAGRCFSKIVVSPSNPDRIYAAITRAGGFPELAAAKGHPLATAEVGVFRSDDGGRNWTQLLNGLPNLSATDLAMDPNNANVLYAGIGRIFGSTSNGIYKTTNGGNSWTKLGGGLPGGSLGRISLAVAPSDSNRLYTLITNPSNSFGGGASTRGAWRSSNAGSSWTSIPVGSIQATYGWYLSVVSVRPTDPNTVIMGGLTLVRSTNSGGSWSSITPPHVDLHAVAWDANGRLLVGDDGGVHRSNNVGSSWSSRNNGLGSIQFYAGVSSHPTNDDILYGGTQDNGSNRRNSGGATWSQVFGGDGGWTQVDQNNGNRVFVEFQGTGNLYRSTTGGSGFSHVGGDISFSDRNCFLPPFLIDPSNSNRMLYATQRIWRSTNGGSNWSAISGDLSNGSGAIRALAMAPTNSNRVYAATNDGNIQMSTNGGQSFTRIANGVPGWPRVTRELQVDPKDDRILYVAVSNFGVDQILRTPDAGQTWEVLDGNLPDVPVNVIANDPTSNPPVIFAGTDRGLFASISDGQTWGRYGKGLPNAPVIDIRLDKERQRIILTTQGRGAWMAEYRLP